MDEQARLKCLSPVYGGRRLRRAWVGEGRAARWAKSDTPRLPVVGESTQGWWVGIERTDEKGGF
jgi:hypothetical protein